MWISETESASFKLNVISGFTAHQPWNNCQFFNNKPHIFIDILLVNQINDLEMKKTYQFKPP